MAVNQPLSGNGDVAWRTLKLPCRLVKVASLLHRPQQGDERHACDLPDSARLVRGHDHFVERDAIVFDHRPSHDLRLGAGGGLARGLVVRPGLSDLPIMAGTPSLLLLIEIAADPGMAKKVVLGALAIVVDGELRTVWVSQKRVHNRRRGECPADRLENSAAREGINRHRGVADAYKLMTDNR